MANRAESGVTRPSMIVYSNIVRSTEKRVNHLKQMIIEYQRVCHSFRYRYF